MAEIDKVIPTANKRQQESTLTIAAADHRDHTTEAAPSHRLRHPSYRQRYLPQAAAPLSQVSGTLQQVAVPFSYSSGPLNSRRYPYSRKRHPQQHKETAKESERSLQGMVTAEGDRTAQRSFIKTGQQTTSTD
jgi:hypothetical protein